MADEIPLQFEPTKIDTPDGLPAPQQYRSNEGFFEAPNGERHASSFHAEFDDEEADRRASIECYQIAVSSGISPEQAARMYPTGAEAVANRPPTT